MQCFNVNSSSTHLVSTHLFLNRISSRYLRSRPNSPCLLETGTNTTSSGSLQAPVWVSSSSTRLPCMWSSEARSTCRHCTGWYRLRLGVYCWRGPACGCWFWGSRSSRPGWRISRAWWCVRLCQVIRDQWFIVPLVPTMRTMSIRSRHWFGSVGR